MSIEIPTQEGRDIFGEGEVSKGIEVWMVIHDVMVKINQCDCMRGECEDDREEASGSVSEKRSR